MRRALDTNNSDEETDNEEKQTTKAAGEKENEIIADELVVKKKARHSKPFTEDVLTLPDGLQRIYEEFPQTCRFRGRGSEAKDIKKLMNMYREWAFQLHPGTAYTDIIAKCEVLGTKGKTRSCVQNLRDRERSRYITEVLDVINKRKFTALDGNANINRSTAGPVDSETSAVVDALPTVVSARNIEIELSADDSFTSPEAF